MNSKKLARKSIIIGLLGITSATIVHPVVYADTSISQNSLLKTYYNVLDSETKEIIDKGDAVIEEKDNGDIKKIIVKNKTGNIISETTIEKITTEQAIKNSMEIDKLTYDEAKNLVDSKVKEVQSKHSLTKSQAVKSTEWQTISNDKGFSFNSTYVKTRLSGDFLLYRNGSFGQIEGLKSVFHRIVNGGKAVLESVNARPMTTHFPTTKATMKSDATLAITTTQNIAFGLQSDFGFSISYTGGGNWICRKPITQSYTYYI